MYRGFGLQSVAGYTFQEILDASHPQVEHWRGVGNQGVAEIYLVPLSWEDKVEALPKKWSAFCDFEVQPFGGKLAVIIPGFLHSDLYNIHSQLGPNASIVFAWHIASVLAVLHDTGRAHGMLHARSVGLDENGQLSIRPSLLPVEPEPDANANAQATDCWQLAGILEALIGEKNIQQAGERIRLLIGGLRQERANIRLQPARALRQSLVAIAESNPSWEKMLKSALGDEWGMDVLPPIEHSIIPKLYPQRPRARLPQGVDLRDYNPWSSPFVSHESTPLESPKKISLPSAKLTENKIRLPMPTKVKIFTEDEGEPLDIEEQTTAQIRLPFASVLPKVAMVAVPEQSSEELGELNDLDDAVLVQEDTFSTAIPSEAPSVTISLVGAVHEPAKIQEEASEDISSEVSQEEEMLESLDINLMMEENLITTIEEETSTSLPSDLLSLEEEIQHNDVASTPKVIEVIEDTTPKIVLQKPIETTRILEVDESEDETVEHNEEQTAIAIEAMIERRELEQVEEVLLPEKEPEVIKERVQVVPEFFEESEEPEPDSYESYEEENEFVADTIQEASLGSHHDQQLDTQEDFLSSIFNERDLEDLEVSASNRVSSILPSVQDVPFSPTEESKGNVHHKEEPSEGLSEQVAGFEVSFDDSESERPSVSEKRNVHESLNAAFEQQDNAHNEVSIEMVAGEQPRWMSAKGITASVHREDELGSGKWGEAQSNLDQDILQEVMSATPVRELDLDDDGNGWALLLVGLAGLVLVVLMLYGFLSSL